MVITKNKTKTGKKTTEKKEKSQKSSKPLVKKHKKDTVTKSNKTVKTKKITTVATASIKPKIKDVKKSEKNDTLSKTKKYKEVKEKKTPSLKVKSTVSKTILAEKKEKKNFSKPIEPKVIVKNSSPKIVEKQAKIKNILISQPYPESEKSPYFDLAKRYNLNLDFNQFICVQGISASEFRKQKVNLLDYSAIILTSKNAIDHFFRMCQDMRIMMPDSTKYFCLNENLSYYLQKYIIYRKRKIFYGSKDIADMISVMKKHKTEKFLLPCSDVNKREIIKPLDDYKINYTKAVIYRTVSNDMSHLGKLDKYDMMIFFSHAGICSLFKNFPNFKQGTTKLACVGATTTKAAYEYGLRIDIEAPTPEYPSIVSALDAYLKKIQKGK